MRICVLSDDELLGRLLELECQSVFASVCRGGSEVLPPADLYLCDLETVTPPKGDVITFGKDGDYPRAYSAERLRAELFARQTESKPSPLRLCKERRSALFCGEEIFFSRREFDLLSVLYEANGAFCTRAALIERVWDGAADARTVNVYIHYLREKLERGGKRLFYSDRARGYALIRGGDVC